MLFRFVNASKPGYRSGFDVDEADLMELEMYHDVIVASAVFGKSELKKLWDVCLTVCIWFTFSHGCTCIFVRKL